MSKPVVIIPILFDPYSSFNFPYYINKWFTTESNLVPEYINTNGSQIDHFSKLINAFGVIDENSLVQISAYHSNQQSEILSREIKKILPTTFNNFNFTLSYKKSNGWRSHVYQLLKFGINSEFGKKKDAVEYENHYGTILLFPPNYINVFTGGELIFYDGDKEYIKIDPSSFKEWTLVAFDLMEYEHKPITSGTCYIFKTPLLVPKKYWMFREGDQSPIEFKQSHIEDAKKDYDNMIEMTKKEYSEKIKLLQIECDNKIQILKDKADSTCCRKLNQRSALLLDYIQKSYHNNIVLILDKYYDEPKPLYLSGEDILLYNEIVKHYQIQMTNIGCDDKFDDGKKINYSKKGVLDLSQYDSINMSLTSKHDSYNIKYDLKIIAQADNFGKTPGIKYQRYNNVSDDSDDDSVDDSGGVSDDNSDDNNSNPMITVTVFSIIKK
jgi:hypothetical protein